jgi:hypothetical protein
MGGSIKEQLKDHEMFLMIVALESVKSFSRFVNQAFTRA